MRRAALLLAVALLTLGCDSANQNPFIVRVTDINNGGSTLFADVIHVDQSGSVTVPTELVPMVLTNKRYQNGTVPDAGTYWYDFQVRRYEVKWRWGSGSVAPFDLTPFDHVQTTSLVVPFDGEATLAALLVPIGMKTTPPFDGLAAGGAINLFADINVVGTSAIDETHEINVRTSLAVAFANYADE
jgi:hypothetical protein